jgi:hypothetical protein
LVGSFWSCQHKTSNYVDLLHHLDGRLRAYTIVLQVYKCDINTAFIEEVEKVESKQCDNIHDDSKKVCTLRDHLKLFTFCHFLHFPL